MSSKSVSKSVASAGGGTVAAAAATATGVSSTTDVDNKPSLVAATLPTTSSPSLSFSLNKCGSLVAAAGVRNTIQLDDGRVVFLTEKGVELHEPSSGIDSSVPATRRGSATAMAAAMSAGSALNDKKRIIIGAGKAADCAIVHETMLYFYDWNARRIVRYSLLQTGQELAASPKLSSRAWCLAANADASLLVCGTASSGLILIDKKTLEIKKRALAANNENATTSPSGATVVAAAATTATSSDHRHEAAVESVMISDLVCGDDWIVAVADNGQATSLVYRLDAELNVKWKVSKDLPPRSSCCAVSIMDPKSKVISRVITGGWSKFSILSFANGAILAHIPLSSHALAVSSVHFLSQTHVILSCSDFAVSVWDTDSKTQCCEVKDCGWKISLSQNRARVLACSGLTAVQAFTVMRTEHAVEELQQQQQQ